MSRLINRLVAASGGWECFLYETLEDVVNKVGLNGFTGEGEEAVQDAQEILDEYLACHSKTVKRTKDDVDKVSPHVKVPDVSKKEPVKEATVNMRPQKSRCQIYVDDEVGASNGSLPLPIGHILSDRKKLVVTSFDGGVHFASSEADGQIKSSRVSGHISADGKYRLVFQKVDLGKALIHYEHIPGPAPKKAPKPTAAPPAGGYKQPAPVVQQVNPEMAALEEQIARTDL